MRQSFCRFPLMLGKCVFGLWPDLRTRGQFPLHLTTNSLFLADLQAPFLCRTSLNHVLLQTYQQRAVVTESNPRLGCSLLTSFIPNSGSSTALQGFICSWPCMYQIPEYLKWEQFKTNPELKLTAKPCPVVVHIGKLLFTISRTNFKRWPSLTLDLLSSFCFLWQKEVIFLNSHFIQEVPLKSPRCFQYITAAELYYVALKKRGKQ